jgi:hypothetical protein
MAAKLKIEKKGHLELSDTILKWDYPRTIPVRFGLIWFSGFRGKDLNVIFYQNMPNLHNRYSHWANWNQTLVEWSLDGPLPKLCPVIMTSNQDGRQAPIGFYVKLSSVVAAILVGGLKCRTQFWKGTTQ